MKNFNQVNFKRDTFFLLKFPKVTQVRNFLKWAELHALLTQITFLDCTQSLRKQLSDKKIDDLLSFITKKNKSNLRVILRKGFNWYGWFSDDVHIEDIIEVGMWGIEINSKKSILYNTS